MRQETMQLENAEGIADYFIRCDWHAGRRRGISAFLRVKDEEEFIEPCLLSIKDFFDEIVIALNDCTDSTPQIIEGLALPTVRTYDYPFKLHHNGPGHDAIPANSVHDNAYYYNWLLSKTRFSHVCKWDGDMVALPALYRGVRRLVLCSNVVHITGLNIAGEHWSCLSKLAPFTREPRFFRVQPHTFYRQGKLTQRFTHSYRRKLRSFRLPVFLHFKTAKSVGSATKIWPADWRSVGQFQALHLRRLEGPPYTGPFPDALKPRIVERALERARLAQELRGQETVMRTMGDLLFQLRNEGRTGDVVEIGSFYGKTTVFLASVMRTLFPRSMLLTIDPYTEKEASRALHADSAREISQVYRRFVENTADLKNHLHLKLKSQEAAAFVPSGLLLSFIDGEHTYEAVLSDFEMLTSRTQPGGIIAVDDFRNRAWPEVGRAYERIARDPRVKLIRTDGKAAYFRKRNRLLWCGCVHRAVVPGLAAWARRQVRRARSRLQPSRCSTVRITRTGEPGRER